MVQISADNSGVADSKAHRKQLEILAAASRAFRRQGLHATGMRDIAAESRMHVGNLYYYFRNKQELLAFCQRHTLIGLIELAERISQQVWQADEKLYRLIIGHIVRLNDEMPGSLAHLEIEALEQPLRRDILRARDRYEDAVRRLVQEGIDNGLFRQVDAGVVVKAILGAVNWTVKWFQQEGEKSSEVIGSEFAQVLVGGLLAPNRTPTFAMYAPDPGGADV
jgi:AcrR family transcriptional regulator